VTALIVAAMVLFGIALIVAGLVWPRGEDIIETRLTAFAVRPRTLEEMELALPFADRVIKPTMRRMSWLVLKRTPSATLEKLRHDLEVAGHPGNMSAEDFMGIRGLAGVGLAVLGCLLGLMMGMSVILGVAGFMVFGVVGFMLPNFWLQSNITKRKKEVQRALPDALDLLSITVEAGLGFDAAIHKVTTKWNNTLTREFERYLAEMRVGKPRREALRDLSNRLDVSDVTSFIAAVVQADQLGASITKTLQVQSEQMRMRRRQRAEKLAHEAPIKMLIPMALFMLPVIYVVIFGPMVPKMASMIGFK